MRKKCEICGFDFPYHSGNFTIHLMKEHNLLIRDYIIQYELSGVTPKCQCGYCDDDAPFFRGIFLERIGKHQKYEWLMDQYIKKYGVPKCETCGNDVKWNRGIPNKYCSHKCVPNACWNQDQVRKTVKEKYGVENVSFLDDIKSKISISNKYNYSMNKKEIVKKFNDTCMKRLGVDFPVKSIEVQNKMKSTYLKNLGVDHPSKLLINRQNSSKRMIKNNSEFDFTNCYKIKKYKDTNLFYQSLYEYHFLEYCEKMNIFDRVKNGNMYDFLPEESDYGFRTITDFSIDDIEIEIKSSYILKKQGGESVINIKRSAVERAGKKYLLILDKNYSEFEKTMNSI
jgi:hypothetical protein